MEQGKVKLDDTPIAFKVEPSIKTRIEEIMIAKRNFNRSEIMREIFIIGLEIFEKKK